MINMGGAQQHRSYHRQHLTTRVRSTHPAAQPHRPIHQPFQTQPHYQRPGRQQPSVGTSPSSSKTTSYRSIFCNTPLTGSAS